MEERVAPAGFPAATGTTGAPGIDSGNGGGRWLEPRENDEGAPP